MRFFSSRSLNTTKNDLLLMKKEGIYHVLEEKIPFVKKLLDVVTEEENLRKNEAYLHEGRKKTTPYSSGSLKTFYDFLEDLHPSEISYILRQLDNYYRQRFIYYLKNRFDPKIFLSLVSNGHLLATMVSYFSVEEIIDIVTLLNNDDVVCLLKALQPQKRQEILLSFSFERQEIFKERLRYPKDSAGHLMKVEIIVLQDHWTPKEGVDFLLAQKKLPRPVGEIFVVNKDKILLGKISISFLFKTYFDTLAKKQDYHNFCTKEKTLRQLSQEKLIQNILEEEESFPDFSQGFSKDFPEKVSSELQLPNNPEEPFSLSSQESLGDILQENHEDQKEKKEEKTLGDLLDPVVHPVLLNSSHEEIAINFQLYNLICAPVIDEHGVLFGMLTADDVIDMIEREAGEDLLHMGRIHHADLSESILKTSLNRIHWLILTLLNTLLTALVIDGFQETLGAKIALTALMPVAAAMGGNTGIQASTVIIRGLATKELTRSNFIHALLKELSVALLNGSVLATLMAFGTYFWMKDISLSCVLFGAVLFNMLWSGFAGTFLPISISRLNFDPALSTGPLLTITTDVLGYGVFLTLAKLFLG